MRFSWSIPLRNVCLSYGLGASNVWFWPALGPQGGQRRATVGQTCGPTSILSEFTSGPRDAPPPAAPPKPLTFPPRTPTRPPQTPLPDMLVLIKDVWVDALNPSYFSKTSFEKKEGLFGERSAPGRVWGWSCIVSAGRNGDGENTAHSSRALNDNPSYLSRLCFLLIMTQRLG